jgi:hypothetical protein
MYGDDAVHTPTATTKGGRTPSTVQLLTINRFAVLTEDGGTSADASDTAEFPTLATSVVSPPSKRSGVWKKPPSLHLKDVSIVQPDKSVTNKIPPTPATKSTPTNRHTALPRVTIVTTTTTPQPTHKPPTRVLDDESSIVGTTTDTLVHSLKTQLFEMKKTIAAQYATIQRLEKENEILFMDAHCPIVPLSSLTGDRKKNMETILAAEGIVPTEDEDADTTKHVSWGDIIDGDDAWGDVCMAAE